MHRAPHLPRLLFVLLICASTLACGSEPAGPPEVYRVRGVVRQLPSAAPGGGELSVRHEAIPGFKNADGEVVGMESMTMPFPIADPALTEDLAAGDKIEMELEVRWDGGNPLSVTRIDKLPPETPLAFESDG